MRNATHEELGILNRFVSACCHRGLEFKATAAEIFAAFEVWRKANALFPISKRRLSTILQCGGFPRRRSNGAWYLGLKRSPRQYERPQTFEEMAADIRNSNGA